MTYSPSEKNSNKAVFQNYLMNVSYDIPDYANKKIKKAIEKLKEEKNGPKTLSKENMIGTIVLRQKYIERVLKLIDKISFQEFVEKEMKENCSTLKGSTILFQETIIHGKIPHSLISLFPKANTVLVPVDRIAKAFETKEDIFVAFPIIKRLPRIKTNISSKIVAITYKIIIHTKSKEIIGFIEHSGITSYSYFRKKILKN
ncbi:conserved hypothetical protein [Tenacibaculum maritimum]|nr:conserved hypothetical protein [Tenacibaculum maritimum]